MTRNLIFLLISVLLLVSPALAHSPSETHSVLQMKQDQAQLQIEFPWTISEAIREAYPKESEQEDFWTLLGLYIGEHVQLSKDGNLIPASRMYQLPGDHSHSATLVLYYPVEQMKGIELRNTLLFNLNQEQKNHHRIHLEDETEFSFVTVPGEASFFIGEEKEGGISAWWYLLILPFLLLFVYRRIST